MSIDQYLARYAEPEAHLAKNLSDRFERVIVIPARAEDPAFVEGLRPALLAAKGSSLVIIVINGRDDDPIPIHQINRRALDHLRRATIENTRLLIVDRATKGNQFVEKQGVGLARKIGCDVALAVIASGRVAAPWIFMTDADVRLPVDYFAAADTAPADASTIVYPFVHDPAEQAIQLYEMSLRYYVLGLAWAGSPYAFHTIGSTIAVRADAYALVRGVPKREAGEDFYFLNKLAKLGPLYQPSSPQITIEGRHSDRVPFGTGAARTAIEADLARDEPFRVYHPGSFIALKSLTEAIDKFVVTGEFVVSDPRLRTVVDEMEIAAALEDARVKTRSKSALRRRIHGWLDAFRTLKLMHGLRDQGLPNVPWEEAFRRAPFIIWEPSATEDWRSVLIRSDRERLRRINGAGPRPQGQELLFSRATRSSTADSAS